MKQVYNAQGYLSEVRHTGSNVLYWRADSQDAAGQLTQSTLGNGLTTVRSYDAATARIEAISTGLGSQNTVQDLNFVYDPLGNLTERRDTNQFLSESFAYDPLNRLIQARLNATGSPSFTSTQDFSYDSIGNITYKTGVGYYRYGAATAGPHAVTQTHVGATVLSNFSYDANGNQLSGNGRNQTYTAFNNLRISSKGSNTTRFDYDPERQRIFQSSVEGGVTTNTVYVGGNYEKITKGSLIEQKHYIFAGGERIAVYTQRSSGASDTRYLHTDHLGSVNAISDAAGEVVEYLSLMPTANAAMPLAMGT